MTVGTTDAGADRDARRQPTEHDKGPLPGERRGPVWNASCKPYVRVQRDRWSPSSKADRAGAAIRYPYS